MKQSKKLKTVLGYPTFGFQKFHRESSNKHQEMSVDLGSYPQEWKKIYFKSYPRFDSIYLPKPKKIVASVSDVLEKRESVRDFTKKKIDLQQISNILFWSLGEKKTRKKLMRRYYPSAGARYPVEAYLLSFDSKLERGVYHYYSRDHLLERMWPFPENEKSYAITDPLLNAPLVLVLTAVFARSVTKYLERGYRYSLIEAGHIGQNVCLVCASQGVSTCCSGGFVEEQLHRLLDIDGVRESAVYTVAMGVN